MPTLDEIELEIQNILSAFAEEGQDLNELDNHVKEYLKDLKYQEQKKIDAIGHVIRKKESEIDFIKSEEQRLKKRKQSIENSIARLKNYIKDVMITNELQNIKGAISTLYLRPSEVIDIIDENQIPPQYVEEKITKTPQKKLIKEAIKNGEIVPGASLRNQITVVLR